MIELKRLLFRRHWPAATESFDFDDSYCAAVSLQLSSISNNEKLVVNLMLQQRPREARNQLRKNTELATGVIVHGEAVEDNRDVRSSLST